MAPIEDSRTHASVFLEMCRSALQLQYRRVLALTEVPRDTTEWRVIEPDCYLLVLALQQAIIGIEAVAHFEGGLIKDLVDPAMATMTREHHGLRDLKDLRDMLTHFDEYLKGVGRLQLGGQRRRQAIPDQDPDQDFDVHLKWRYSRNSGGVVLWVRALGRSVEVFSMSRSVMGLIAKVQEAL